MGGVRTFLALLTAAICAFVLVACGGDDDSGTTAGTTDGASAQAPANQAPNGDGNGKSDGKGDGSGGGNDGGGGEDGGNGSASGGNGSASGGNGGDAPSGDAGLGGASGGPSKDPVPSLKGERSYSFSHVGGDNSIQEYGDEAGGGERAEATEAVLALFRAMESGDWSEVCAKYLSAANLEQLKLLSEKSKDAQGKGCAELIGGFTQNIPGRTPDSPKDSIASMRVEDGVGFAIYRGIDDKGYAIPMKLEGGVWKLTALAPTPLEF